MPDLNRVFLLGRLTRDPTLRHTPGGVPVAEFGIALNRSWSGPDGERREETCFVDIVAWARRAEVCHDNLEKGSPVFLEGRLHLDTWESASGDRRSRLKVVANNVVFLGRSPRGSKGRGRQRPPSRREGRPSPAEGPEASPRGQDDPGEPSSAGRSGEPGPGSPDGGQGDPPGRSGEEFPF